MFLALASAVARALHEASTVVEAEEPNEPPLDFDPLGAPPLQTHTTKPRAAKPRTRMPAERALEDGQGRAESDDTQADEELERGDRVAEHDIDAAVAAQCVCDALQHVFTMCSLGADLSGGNRSCLFIVLNMESSSHHNVQHMCFKCAHYVQILMVAADPAFFIVLNMESS
ncbi:hypothetical protein DUNSADRAFT_15971 [Dunaliella salina]|uniref:Encoded protein n=1 Tax=Dunaliella salina TaxID=3046 RepID=A0ABQ7G4I5_DUNSA|nr:hypothetical protein DUNSADRAFT_15971 [Dunaliella salina]|eukprot:KAF5829521.1 hypothetical protein DUNSADRAFT_15971 [Dunaliella salina]